MDDQGVDQAVLIDPKLVNPKWEPGTFDGRDLFTPAGAKLAANGGRLGAIGAPVDAATLARLQIPRPVFDPATGAIRGQHLRTDEPYGNVWTNITRDELTSAGIRLGDTVQLSVGARRLEMPFVVSFGVVPEGSPLAYMNSSGNLAFALNMGDFRKVHAMAPGTTMTVSRGR
jgi:hypothetical protein